jgi:hypothetical protein
MIPQRNISLLSNRLAREGGRRIPEAVLERDYCLAWFLSILAQSPLKPILAFKGGTALKRCYFDNYRFSEDLDFTLLQPIDLEEIQRHLETLYAEIRDASGIAFAFDRLDRHGHANSHTFYLRYTGPLPSENSVKVDITIAEHITRPCEERVVLRSYPEFVVDSAIGPPDVDFAGIRGRFSFGPEKAARSGAALKQFSRRDENVAGNGLELASYWAGFGHTPDL